MSNDDSAGTLRPINADDFQQGWLAGWLCAKGHPGPVGEVHFVEAVRAWQNWLAANGHEVR